MAINYTITPELRVKLKDPFGTLIQGTFYETINEIKKLVETENPSIIISVGDIVSRNLHQANLNPQLTIIDNISSRTLKMPQEAPVKKTIYVKNPQGTITHEAILAVKKALKKKGHTHIVVDGEEDLLALIAVIHAPTKSFVVYGQPQLGLVIVRVTSEKKAQARAFLNEMNPSKS
jgi:uncharacterized protein (UPF0218 family)